MKIDELLETAKDSVTVKRIFGEPYERDGTVVIPAARVAGGGGGGQGQQNDEAEGEGGGFGVVGRPAGAYVIKEGRVTWLPAVDPNRVVMAVAFVIVAYLLSRPRIIRARAKVQDVTDD